MSDTAGSGGYRASIGGTCTATAIIFHGKYIKLGDTQYTNFARATALGGLVTAVGGSGTDTEIIIEGTITVNAAGTLTVQLAQFTAAGTTTLKRGAAFMLLEA
jgi:hypothetical protein